MGKCPEKARSAPFERPPKGLLGLLNGPNQAVLPETAHFPVLTKSGRVALKHRFLIMNTGPQRGNDFSALLNDGKEGLLENTGGVLLLWAHAGTAANRNLTGSMASLNLILRLPHGGSR